MNFCYSNRLHVTAVTAFISKVFGLSLSGPKCVSDSWVLMHVWLKVSPRVRPQRMFFWLPLHTWFILQIIFLEVNQCTSKWLCPRGIQLTFCWLAYYITMNGIWYMFLIYPLARLGSWYAMNQMGYRGHEVEWLSPRQQNCPLCTEVTAKWETAIMKHAWATF